MRLLRLSPAVTRFRPAGSSRRREPVDNSASSPGFCGSFFVIPVPCADNHHDTVKGGKEQEKPAPVSRAPPYWGLVYRCQGSR